MDNSEITAMVVDYESGIANISKKNRATEAGAKKTTATDYHKLAVRVSDMYSMRSDMIYSLHMLRQYQFHE